MTGRILVWTGVAVLLLLVASIGLGSGGPFEIVGHLLLGWAFYAFKTLPKVEVDGLGVAFLAICVGLAAVVGHRFCRWLAADRPWKPQWTAAGLALVVVLFAAGTAFTGVVHQAGWLVRSPEPWFTSSGRASNDRNASASLKTVASAQADFRGNDRDNNKIQDYWRGDIAGLYALKPEGIDDAIKLIELSIAGADAAPVTDVQAYIRKSPKAGYWYKALRFADEDPAKPDTDRFAACAFPDGPTAGRHVFVISHENTIYRRDWKGPSDTPSIYPDDPLEEGWTKLD